MNPESEAFFGNILVSNVASSIFTKSGMPVLLAIRIEGFADPYFRAERFSQLFENVVVHRDGEWWEV
jgi:hypothetical protein